MAKYRLLAPMFHAPNLLPAGTVITVSDDWSPGDHVEPLDDAAEAAMEKWREEHKLGADPIEALPVTLEVTEEAPKVSEEVDLTLAESGVAQAKPGPTDGGSATGKK